MEGEKVTSEPIADNELSPTVDQNLTSAIASLTTEMAVLEKKQQKNFFEKQTSYEPWKGNIFLKNFVEEQEWGDPQNIKPEEVLRRVIERSRSSVSFIRRLEKKGFDLATPDYRGKLENVVRFVEGGFWENALNNASGMFMGDSKQHNVSYTDHRQALLRELLYLFSTGSWNRGKDISISDHEVLHAQQFNPEGKAEPNAKMKRMNSIPLLLCLDLVDKAFPKLKINEWFPSSTAIHEAHAYLGSTEDFMLQSFGNRETVEGMPKLIIDHLKKSYEFSAEESSAAVWAMLRLRAITDYIQEFGSKQSNQELPEFDKDVSTLVYDWVLRGKVFSSITHTFPDMEAGIREFEKLAGMPEPTGTNAHERKRIIAKMVQWDMLNRRVDVLRFTTIAHDEIASELNSTLRDRAIKTAYLPNVIAAIDKVKRKSLNYWRHWGDYAQVFFPADEEHPYRIDRMSGYAFSLGKYQGRAVIDAVDEGMDCYKVELTNKLNEEEPKIKSLSKMNENHMITVFPRFIYMLTKAREQEKLGLFPHWGDRTQSLLTAALESRFDGMPWQYRFTAVIYGLGLEDKQNELMEYMTRRIQSGELSSKQHDRWIYARGNSSDELKKIKSSWSSKASNQLDPELQHLVQTRVNELPDQVFSRLSIYDMHEREGDDIAFYLGPVLFSAIEDKIT